MTSLIEIVCCIVIFSFIMVATLAIMSYCNTAILDEHKLFAQQTDMEFLLDNLTQDIKSCSGFDATGDTLTIRKHDNTLITYHVNAKSIDRNEEQVIGNIIVANFTAIDEDRVDVYVFATDGSRIDTVFHR